MPGYSIGVAGKQFLSRNEPQNQAEAALDSSNPPDQSPPASRAVLGLQGCLTNSAVKQPCAACVSSKHQVRLTLS